MVWVLETNSQRHINKRQTTRNLLRNEQLPFLSFLALRNQQYADVCIYIFCLFSLLYTFGNYSVASAIGGFTNLKATYEETNLAIGRVHWLSFDHFRAFFSLSHLLNGEWTVRKLYFLSNICFRFSLSMMAF